MARGGKFGLKREARNNIPLSRKGSDESDEDYTVGEDEDFYESEDEDCSLAEDESDENLGEFVAEEEEDEEEEEEEEEEESVTIKKKVGKPEVGKSFQGKKKNGFAKGRKKNVVYSEEEDCDDDDDDKFFVSKPKGKHKLSPQEEEDDDDVEDLYQQEPNDFDVKMPRKSFEKKNGVYTEKPRKRTKMSYREEEVEGDYDDSYEDDDEEFTPDEVDGFEEEELPVTKKKKVGRLRLQETQVARGKRGKRNTEVSKKTKRKEPMIEKSSRKRSRSDHGGSAVKNPASLTRRKLHKPVRGRRRKPSLDFDSDFASSGSLDCEYTVSEEEREQIREASKFCGSVVTSLRSSNALKMVKEEEFLHPQRKCPGRKGKEKVVDMNVAAGKQVCGICLSEEGKRTVRGILNCCSHYFCFTCIMEWSKVESRCPLCKQRFATVCRTARDDGGHDLRDSVIQVPERDQVYQPTEEELRGYLDPYENVLCTECLQGGDDAFMLLCDICDSPAHSYCVGLGREVPEGNWYCDGCRPTAFASFNAPLLNPTPDIGACNNLPVISSPVATVRETFDLNELYVPETPQTQVAIPSPSPRHSVGDTQTISPGSGSSAFTLFERRRIQRQIHQLLNNRSRQLDGNDAVTPVTAISLFGSQITSDGVLAPQHIVTQSRMAPHNTHRQGRLLDNSMPLLYRREVMSPRFSSLRGHMIHNQASTSTNQTFDGLTHGEFVGNNERIGLDTSQQQLYPCSNTSNSGSEASISPFQYREAPAPSRTLQGTLRSPF